MEVDTKKLIKICKSLTGDERKALLVLLKNGEYDSYSHALLGTVNKYSNDYVDSNDIDNIQKLYEDGNQ